MTRTLYICTLCPHCRTSQANMNHWCSLDDYDCQTACNDDLGMSNKVFEQKPVPKNCPYAMEQVVVGSY